MAHLVKVKRSPYWYVRYRDVHSGKLIQKNTKLRAADRTDTKAAMRIRDKHSTDEAKVAPSRADEFLAWVPEFLQKHYKNENSKKRYLYAWDWVSQWLVEKNIRHPAEIKYAHAEEYIDWRTGKGVSHNTARLEMKFLSSLVTTAIRREIVTANPMAAYKVGTSGTKEKPDLTDADIKAARLAFKTKPAWMSVALEICLNLGCRFNESSIPKSRINFQLMEITICDSKRKPGDKRKLFTVPITKAFSEYLEKLPFENGLTVPALDGVMNQRFNETMRAACGATSHSCRVAFISRCHRAGLSEMEAMRLVNHSQSLVHQIYSRLSSEDVRPALTKVKPPPPETENP